MGRLQRVAFGSMTDQAQRSLAERLGYSPDTRLVIISCDDLGSCHAANEGVFFYLVLDKSRSNLALARRKTVDVEKELKL